MKVCAIRMSDVLGSISIFMGLTLMVMLMANHANAGLEEVRLGEAALAGTGCRGGVGKVVVNAETDTIELTYEDFSANLERGDGKSLARVGCTLAMPVSLPEGKALIIKGVSIKGKAALERGISSTLKSESFFAGGKGNVLTRVTTGPKIGTIAAAITNKAKKAPRTECGGEAILRNNTSIVLNRTLEEASGGVSLVQDAAVVKIKLAVVSCN
jgi:hypothetical protein